MSNTVLSFQEAKRAGRKLSLLTAYDYTTAKLMDQAGVNGILVGDSVGMVSLGYKDTLPVTMEDMIHHSRAVSRGVAGALLITDMPFMSYQACVHDAVINAGRLIKEGRAHAVKLEGGREICPHIKAIVEASIPVMGHLGLTPQSVHMFGGFKVQGKSEEAAKKLLADARALEEAGAFSIVLEGIPAKLAALLTKAVSIPTIGIGAGKDCDGQILVCQDMLGMYPDFTPTFVKRYAELGTLMQKAVADYIAEVQNGSFPAQEHSFTMADGVLDKLY